MRQRLLRVIVDMGRCGYSVAMNDRLKEKVNCRFTFSKKVVLSIILGERDAAQVLANYILTSMTDLDLVFTKSS